MRGVSAVELARKGRATLAGAPGCGRLVGVDMPEGTCTTEECTKARIGRSKHCSMHRARLARTGTTDKLDRTATPEQDAERFWSKVDQRGPTECWPWRGVVLDVGYGQFRAQGRRFMAHRYAYEITVGPIADGLEIDHVRAWGCTRTDCVNPAHLEAVTPAENKRRSDNIAGVNARKKACRLGHPYRCAPDGTRYCPTCKADWERARARRRRSA